MPRKHVRPASHGGVLWSSPWMRAPLLLLRRPSVFLAIVAATAVLAIAASSGVLFLSTLGTAGLRAQAGDACPEASMPVMYAGVPGAALTQQHAGGLSALRRGGALGAPYWVDLSAAQIQATPVTLYARDGALRHVRTLTPDTGQAGVWFPDNFAAKLHLAVGDSVPLAGNDVRITVAGIYRNLSPDPFHLADLPRYWCTWSSLIVQGIQEQGTAPLLISDVPTVARLSAALPLTDSTEPGAGQPVVVSWYDPIPISSISLNAARAADADTRAVAKSYLAAQRPDQAVELQFDPIHGGPPDTLASDIASADGSSSALAGSVLPIDLAGALVALLLVGGAGAFWVANRSREIRLLLAHGVGPGPLAVKAVLETLPAALIGLAAG
ncbi:MAG: hypothetical protein ABI301_02510, partial [Jatrophihabitantaceae bacterium]